MGFSRRSFLARSLGVGAGLTLYPASGISFASGESSYDGPLYVYFHGYGGWDPTHFFDPKGGIVNTYQAGDIQSHGIFNVAPTAWWNEDFKSRRDCYDRFLTRFYNDMILLNGVTATSVVHDLEVRVSLSAKANNYPPLMALLAATINPDLAMSFLNAVELASNTEGIVTQTPILDPRAFREILNSNIADLIQPNVKFQRQEIVDRIMHEHKSKLQQLNDERRLPGRQFLLDQFQTGYRNLDPLHGFVNNLPETFHANAPLGSLKNQADITLAAFKSGVSATAQLRYHHFDSHANHDYLQTNAFIEFLDGITYFMDKAEQIGIADRLVVMVGSEFGRVPFIGKPDGTGSEAPVRFNPSMGTDHYPVTSLFFLRKNLGPKLIGGTNWLYEARKVNPSTNQIDDSSQGAFLSHAAIHASLRRTFGVSQQLHEKFPVDESALFDFFV